MTDLAPGHTLQFIVCGSPAVPFEVVLVHEDGTVTGRAVYPKARTLVARVELVAPGDETDAEHYCRAAGDDTELPLVPEPGDVNRDLAPGEADEPTKAEKKAAKAKAKKEAKAKAKKNNGS